MSTHNILKHFEPKQEYLLEILHALQDNHPQHYLTDEALETTAQYLKLTKSGVYGVATYYSMFSLKPRGRYIVRVCVSPVCELLKADDVLACLHRELGLRTGETTPCGLFTLEVSECLGQCQEAPSMMINHEVYNQLSPEKITAVLEHYRKGHGGGR